MKQINIESGQNLIDIALQEYGNLQAVYVLCSDNDLVPDADLYAGQKLNIREKGVDDISIMDEFVMQNYIRKSIQVNSRVLSIDAPGSEAPDVDLPSFYGAGPSNLTQEGMLLLTQIYRNKKESDDLPYTADMERLWYIYPSLFGQIHHIYQPGGYDAFTSFELLNVTLTINSQEEPYLAYRLKHDTYITADDNFKMSFR